MNYTKEMHLASSGYCMPFEQSEGEIQLTHTYGEQADGTFRHDLGFATRHNLLRAMADGVVSGIGSQPDSGLFQAIRYGDYEVTYGGLTNVLAGFGKKVHAGSAVSVSGSELTLRVTYRGEEIHPVDFLTMIYGNLKMMGQPTELETIEMDIPNGYDADQREIEELMLRFYPDYLAQIHGGGYRVPEHTVQSLRNIFSLSSVKNYFYESLPSYSNPLGLGERAMPLAAKVQNLLIGDFLNFLALRHQIYLSSWSESDKKKVVTQP
jgi:hypothetical protein